MKGESAPLLKTLWFSQRRSICQCICFVYAFVFAVSVFVFWRFLFDLIPYVNVINFIFRIRVQHFKRAPKREKACLNVAFPNLRDLVQTVLHITEVTR